MIQQLANRCDGTGPITVAPVRTSRTHAATRTPDRRLGDAASTVRQAAAGDEAAWAQLVDAYGPLLWSIAARLRLPRDRVPDLVQATWLRLITSIVDIRSPEMIGAWLATTMRRIYLNGIPKQQRERTLPDFARLTLIADQDEMPDAWVIRTERAAIVREALARLPDRQRKLLWYLATNPHASYVEVSAELCMPVGAIGPTRARALGRLRRLLQDDARTAGLIEWSSDRRALDE
jgi:RNA polymerase sigma factor (sigma-70 family)